jgi:hypothetical protein
MVTQIGTVLGTLRYLSPEQAEGKVVGPPADVYSLGVVLDELLDERPAEVRDVIDRARSLDPASRPTADEIATVLRGETLVAPTRVLTRHTSRSRLPLVLAAAAMLAIVAAIVVAATSGSSHHPTRVRPVAHGSSTAAQARNLESWLKTYSR